MKKNLTKIALLVVLVLTMVFAMSFMASAENNGSKTAGTNSVTWSLSGGTLTISGTGDMPDLNNPDDAEWLVDHDKSEITSVVIKSGVTGIGKNSFNGYSELHTVTIADTVVTIGNYGFYNCTAMTSLTLPAGTTYNETVFKGCAEVTSVTLIKTKNAANTGLMRNYTNEILQEGSVSDDSYQITPWYISRNKEITLTISSGITSVGNYAFYGCTGLTGSLTLPSTVKIIGTYAFKNCTGLTGSLTFQTGTKSIGNNAFEGCTGLNGTLTLPSSLTSLGVAAFKGCKNLTGQLVIPSQIKTIWDNTFYGCSGFSGSLDISSVTKIGESAFEDCSGLNGSLVLSLDIESIGENAFKGCSGLTGTLTLHSNITSIGAYAFSGCSGFSGSLNIPTTVKTIGEYAFYDCSGFTGTLSIGSNVASIGVAAFSGCTGITGITVDAGNTVYDSRNNCNAIIKKLNNELIVGCNATVIPSTVKIIGNSAFYNCTGLTGSLSIPAGVTRIDDFAFQGCTGLNGSLIIPDSVTSIGNAAFGGCSNITSLTLPLATTYTMSKEARATFTGCTGLTRVEITGSGEMPNYTNSESKGTPWRISENDVEVVLSNTITNIGKYAFNGCENLTSVNIPTAATSIGAYAFKGCEGLTGNLVISDKVESIGDCAFQGCGYDGILTIGENVETIGRSAFEDCSSLTGGLSIPDSVTSIGNRAFARCESFDGNLEIGDGITEIGEEIFSDCSGLSGNLVIPDGVTEIGDAAFSGCSGFDGTLTIGTNVESIGISAFEECSGLTGDLTISDTVTELGGSAFSDCEGFNGKLTIGNGIENIKEYVFNGCSGLTEVDLADSVKTIGKYAFGYCTGLTEITLPEYVETLGISAFSSCENLETVEIPISVKAIEQSAFSGCISLADVYYASSSFDRSKIDIQDENDYLLNAKWHYTPCEHELVHYERKEATFNEEGNIEYWQCSICDLCFEDEAATKEIAYENIIIPVLDLPPVEYIFYDVTVNDWFYIPVAFVYKRGIMTGLNNYYFGTMDSLTREQFATIIYRLEDSPEVSFAEIYPDIGDGAWFTKPVIWAYKKGIITGYDNGYFGLGDKITREQLATILYRYVKEYKHMDAFAQADLSAYLDEASVSSWAYEAMQWAVGMEIITGKDNMTRLDPTGNATRCECAAIIQRFMNKYGL